MKPEIKITETDLGAIEIVVSLDGAKLDSVVITPIMVKALTEYLSIK